MIASSQGGQQVIQTANGQQIIVQNMQGNSGVNSQDLANNQQIQVLPVSQVGGGQQIIQIQNGQQILQTTDGQTLIYQPVQVDGSGQQQVQLQQTQQIIQAGGQGGAGAGSSNSNNIIMMVPGSGGSSGSGNSSQNVQRLPISGPEMLEEEPLYVNAKQYHRILKRELAFDINHSKSF